MESSPKQYLLRKLPSINDLLASDAAETWLDEHPRSLVTWCLREALGEARQAIQTDAVDGSGVDRATSENLLERAGQILRHRTKPRLRGAINATGVILHTDLGRAVWPAGVVDSIADDLKGYVTLGIDRDSGKGSDYDQRVEYILCELTGAESATVVNNNAAAVMLVLSALATGKETIVSRGQLIEVGGSFRLPEVMAQSGTRMVGVGTTNRTHLMDYAKAITDETAVLFRARPNTYRVVGSAEEVPLDELINLARSKWLTVVDDLGIGALIDLAKFNLPHEPTVSESISAGADVVLFSADKLIGAGQGGIIVGRKTMIDKIRKHPLARAVRPDKTSLMALERTLHLFRDVDRLRRDHPLYAMLTASPEKLQKRALDLAAAISDATTAAVVEVVEGVGYLSTDSLPTESLPTFIVSVMARTLDAGELAQRLRTDDACVFARVEGDKVLLDVRTLLGNQVAKIAQAVARAAGKGAE